MEALATIAASPIHLQPNKQGTVMLYTLYHIGSCLKAFQEGIEGRRRKGKTNQLEACTSILMVKPDSNKVT